MHSSVVAGLQGFYSYAVLSPHKDERLVGAWHPGEDSLKNIKHYVIVVRKDRFALILSGLVLSLMQRIMHLYTCFLPHGEKFGASATIENGRYRRRLFDPTVYETPQPHGVAKMMVNELKWSRQLVDILLSFLLGKMPRTSRQ